MGMRFGGMRRLWIAVVCGCVIGLLASTPCHAAANAISAEKEQNLQEIFEWIQSKLNGYTSEISKYYNFIGRNNGHFQITYSISRNYCELIIYEISHYSHTWSNKGQSDSIKRNTTDSKRTDVVNMSNVNKISFEYGKFLNGYPNFYNQYVSNPDMMESFYRVVFEATNPNSAFNVTERYYKFTSPEPTYNKVREAHKAISLPKFTILIENKDLAERLARAFNDYRKICGAKDELY